MKAWYNTNNQRHIRKLAYGLVHTAAKGIVNHIGNETLRGAVSNFVDAYHKQAIANVDRDVKAAGVQNIETVSDTKPTASITNNSVSNSISTQHISVYRRQNIRGRSRH